MKKRASLPFPPNTETANLLLGPETNAPSLEDLVQRREKLNREIEFLDARITLSAFETICGERDDSQHVEMTARWG
jgi:hypothetical protein